MHKIFVMYKLKPGVTLERYKAWSTEIDQRITPGQPGMIRFEVYAIEGAEKGEPSVHVVEDIEVEDFHAWSKTAQGPGMAYVQETIAQLIDESTLQVIYGSKIVPALLPEGARPPMPEG
ncbi:hypothetical protein [Prosthecomicrobium pneumaticum]|uniref:REDY-like protein HapK n=1 Tax=Prosthecomicrobium pneumaticum TaxID=81895 RepID=A0A7W9FQP8_9HYPH|nr:hypothetical protein [Prosthecomicrobium pneumaticum]MBB5755112.1 hypothetical protein [Prosthecomicrobium pneumaticum]